MQMRFSPSASAVATFLATLLVASFSAHAVEPASADPMLTYTVGAKDKLIRLGQEMLVRPSAWDEVAKINGLKDPNKIIPGQQLRIPLRLLKFQPVSGKLLSTSGDVQVGGAPAQAGASVAEGASVQTGPNSSAVLELGDGSKVKLLPGTLAQVMSNRNYNLRDSSSSKSTTWFSGLMRLAKGTLETAATTISNRAEPLQVRTSTSIIGVRGTQFRVTMDDPSGKTSRSEVIEGKVRADNPAQQSGADLPSGTGAVIDPARKDVVVAKLLPAPDLGGGDAELFKPQAELSWAAVAGANGYRVQVSPSASFDAVVREYKVAGNTASLADLPSANWYARVRGIDGQGLEGFDKVKLIAVRDAKVVVVVVPPWQARNARFAVENGATVLRFAAQTAAGQVLQATSYSAEVATDAGFTTGLQRASAKGTEFSLAAMVTGSYFLRMQAMGADGKTLASETYRFELPSNWGYSVVDVSTSLQALN